MTKQRVVSNVMDRCATIKCINDVWWVGFTYSSRTPGEPNEFVAEDQKESYEQALEWLSTEQDTEWMRERGGFAAFNRDFALKKGRGRR